MKPGEYVLGSAQSRAAARALLVSKRAVEGEGLLVVLRLIGSPPAPGRKCTCPIPPASTVAVCRCFCPNR